MAKLAVFDDFEVYAEMAAGPLRLADHEVLTMVTEEGPLDWERVMHFGPQAISVGLYRKEDAFDRPIDDWRHDVLGYEPLTQMECYPAISIIPILLAGSGLREHDVPTTVNYDVFLVFPREIQLYVPKLEELATSVKTRRRISDYVCPCCASRLVFVKEPATDLSCPKCGTAVAIVDEAHALYMPLGVGPSLPCDVARLIPVARRRLAAERE